MDVDDQPPQPLPFGWAHDRLTRSRSYWLVTSQPDGRPHAAPVWAIWFAGQLWFSTGRESRKGRGLLSRPDVVIHLESGDEVVVVRGPARERTPGEDLDRPDQLYAEKYGPEFRLTMPVPGVTAVVYAVQPQSVLAWTEKEFETSRTRWVRRDGRLVGFPYPT